MTDTRFVSVVNRIADLCEGSVLGTFDLSSRGGPPRVMVVQARNRTHLHTLANRIMHDVGGVKDGRARPLKPSSVPGPWVAIDTGEVVVHLFTARSAQYYDLVGLYEGLAVPA